MMKNDSKEMNKVFSDPHVELRLRTAPNSKAGPGSATPPMNKAFKSEPGLEKSPLAHAKNELLRQHPHTYGKDVAMPHIRHEPLAGMSPGKRKS